MLIGFAVVPLLGAANLTTGAAVVSGIDYLAETIRGTVVTGTLTETTLHTVRGREGPDEHQCFGLLDSDDGRIVGHRVRVWAGGEDGCYAAEDEPARLLPGAGRQISDAIAGGRDSLSDPMPFGGLFGTTDGALVGDTGAFVTGLWPYLFLAPIAVIGDVVVITALRDRLRRLVKSTRPPS